MRIFCLVSGPLAPPLPSRDWLHSRNGALDKRLSLLGASGASVFERGISLRAGNLQGIWSGSRIVEKPAPAPVQSGSKVEVATIGTMRGACPAPAEKVAVANAPAPPSVFWASDPAEPFLAFPVERQGSADKSLEGQIDRLGSLEDGALDLGG